MITLRPYQNSTKLRGSHGHSSREVISPTYSSWWAMVQRCRYPKTTGFALYGGRGIKVCQHWQTFANFLADMGERPKGTTLDRIDPDGHYEPGNVRWATIQVQNVNRRQWRLKLTDEQVRAIRADPRAQHVIGSEYGITQGVVSKIKRRAIWKKLP